MTLTVLTVSRRQEADMATRRYAKLHASSPPLLADSHILRGTPLRAPPRSNCDLRIEFRVATF